MKPGTLCLDTMVSSSAQSQHRSPWPSWRQLEAGIAPPNRFSFVLFSDYLHRARHLASTSNSGPCEVSAVGPVKQM